MEDLKMESIKIEDNKEVYVSDAANSVFDMINRAELFGDHKIDIILIKTEDDVNPWFKAKDIGTILKYENTRKAIRDNIKLKDRKSLAELCEGGMQNSSLFLQGNIQKHTIYINESGLYCLLFSSRLPSAQKFKDWVTEDLLPKIRKIGQEKYLKQLREKEEQLIKSEQRFNRLHKINEELLTYKKLSERNESIYIVSTSTYANQGIFKVGRTKNLKARSPGHNTTHPTGDKVKVLFEIKVNDSVLMETRIHKKTDGLRPDKYSEFIMCPYHLLKEIIELIVYNDNEENRTINTLVDLVYKLRETEFNQEDWTRGIENGIFSEDMLLLEGNEEVARFDMISATEDQKKKFVRKCIEAYKNTIENKMETITWKSLQDYLREQLQIPKYRFKSTLWKLLVKEEERDMKLTIKWR